MIYCVEDDKNVRDLILYALKNNEMGCCGFEDAASFFDAVERELPDLILLDIMMPGMDGYAVLRLRLSDSQTVTVVGTIPLPVVGERLMVTGKWSAHQNYGRQFEAEFLERVLPQNKPDIISNRIFSKGYPASGRHLLQRHCQ